MSFVKLKRSVKKLTGKHSWKIMDLYSFLLLDPFRLIEKEECELLSHDMRVYQYGTYPS